MAKLINVKDEGEGAFLVSINGPVDMENYTDVREAFTPILMSSTKMMIVDMKNVDYLSSVGIGVILNAKTFLESNGGQFVMVGVQPQVQKVFEIIKALPSMCIFESREEFDRYLLNMQKEDKDKEIELMADE